MKELIACVMKGRWPVSAFLLVILVFLGYGAGRVAGTRLVEGVVLRESRFPLLLSRPVGQFYDIYRLLNSSNPFSRLSGYYGLVDNRMIDEHFLIERYRIERFHVVKKTVLWALSFSENRQAIIDFYRSIYGESDGTIQKEIRGLMERVCRGGDADCALPEMEKPGTTRD